MRDLQRDLNVYYVNNDNESSKDTVLSQIIEAKLSIRVTATVKKE